MFIRICIYMCIAALPDAVPVHEYRYESSSLSGYLSLDFHLYSTVAQLRAAPLFNFPCATTTPDNDTLPPILQTKAYTQIRRTYIYGELLRYELRL